MKTNYIRRDMIRDRPPLWEYFAETHDESEELERFLADEPKLVIDFNRDPISRRINHMVMKCFGT